MAAITIQQLEKRYKGQETPAVRALDLSIEAGELFGLLGPNGAGKTTILSVLSGLIPPTSGRVLIHDIDVVREPDRIKPLVGLVPQEIALYGGLTARENLAFFGRLHGLGGAELRARIDICLKIASLEACADRRVNTFSGGMKRRANLVAALVRQPSILILDEPTVGIDAQSRHVIFENLRALNREGMTIVYATHYMEEAQEMCSKVAILDSGHVVKQGAPRQLIAEQPGCRTLDQVFLELTGRYLRD